MSSAQLFMTSRISRIYVSSSKTPFPWRTQFTILKGNRKELYIKYKLTSQTLFNLLNKRDAGQLNKLKPFGSMWLHCYFHTLIMNENVFQTECAYGYRSEKKWKLNSDIPQFENSRIPLILHKKIIQFNRIHKIQFTLTVIQIKFLKFNLILLNKECYTG